MNTPLIEACVDSYASCRAAYRGGADRLELCAHLVIGGTTPSTALFRQVQRDIPVKTNILIRPRFGDFLYSKEELEQMCEEIRTYRELGANGVVIGALTPDGDLDLDAMRRLMNCAGNMDVTLHRAFDMTRDPFAAMEDAIRLGCKTILTSGQQKDPLTGAELLRELFEKADDRIDIMAGCGVKKWNIQEIHDKTGIVVFHTTGRAGDRRCGKSGKGNRLEARRVHDRHHRFRRRGARLRGSHRMVLYPAQAETASRTGNGGRT